MATAKQGRRVDPMDVLMGRRGPDRPEDAGGRDEAVPEPATGSEVSFSPRRDAAPTAERLVTTSISIPDSLRRKMKVKALMENTTMIELIRDVLAQADAQGYFDV